MIKGAKITKKEDEVDCFFVLRMSFRSENQYIGKVADDFKGFRSSLNPSKALIDIWLLKKFELVLDPPEKNNANDNAEIDSKVVVDVGCGSGHLCVRLKALDRLKTSFNLLALDISLDQAHLTANALNDHMENRKNNDNNNHKNTSIDNKNNKNNTNNNNKNDATKNDNLSANYARVIPLDFVDGNTALNDGNIFVGDMCEVLLKDDLFTSNVDVILSSFAVCHLWPLENPLSAIRKALKFGAHAILVTFCCFPNSILIKQGISFSTELPPIDLAAPEIDKTQLSNENARCRSLLLYHSTDANSEGKEICVPIEDYIHTLRNVKNAIEFGDGKAGKWKIEESILFSKSAGKVCRVDPEDDETNIKHFGSKAEPIQPPDLLDDVTFRPIGLLLKAI